MKRREFIKLAGLSAASMTFGSVSKGATRRPTDQRVAVFGGGIAGLTVCHELLDRGFQVTLYETKDQLGGKARSIYLPGTASAASKPLPGEHGFRMFFAFYNHIFDIMKRIPYEKNKSGVRDNLVPLEELCFLGPGGTSFRMPLQPAATVSASHLEGFKKIWTDLFSFSGAGLTPKDIGQFIDSLIYILSSCDARRYSELENISWSAFLGDNRSAALRDIFGSGVTTMVQAIHGNVASARTMGMAFFNVFSQIYRHPEGSIFCLNGPTTEKWINPWKSALAAKNLKVVQNAKLVGFDYANGRIHSANVLIDGSLQGIDADHFVSAVPFEVLNDIIVNDKMASTDSSLASIQNLRNEWLVGSQYYFDQDVRLPTKVVALNKSPWAVSAVSQNAYWQKNVSTYGDGRTKGILSCDVSDWHAPGILYNKPASQCSPDEVREEIWAQLLSHLDNETKKKFMSAKLTNWFIDPAVEFKAEGNAYHDPLFINTTGSWKDRPSSKTKFANLFLAGDYTRSYTDLACMEGACESGKRAVNAILASEGLNQDVKIWRPAEHLIFTPFKIRDYINFKLGRPNMLLA